MTYLKAYGRNFSQATKRAGLKRTFRKTSGKLASTNKREYIDLEEIQKKGIVLDPAFKWTFEGEDKEYDEEYKDFI